MKKSSLLLAAGINGAAAVALVLANGYYLAMGKLFAIGVWSGLLRDQIVDEAKLQQAAETSPVLGELPESLFAITDRTMLVSYLCAAILAGNAVGFFCASRRRPAMTGDD